jgi:lysophospholipase L1-like esterase
MIADRCVLHTAALISNATLQCMSRTQHRSCAGGATNLRLVFINWDNNNNTETDGIGNSNPLTVTASVEYPAGTFYQALFNGDVSVTMGPGGIAISDPIGVIIPAATMFFVRNFAQMASGPNTGKIPTGLLTIASNGEGQILSSGNGSDLTMSGTVTAASVNTYAPVAILGDAGDSNLRSIVMLMDSIAEGYNDSSATEGRGWIARAFQGVAGYHNMGVLGATLNNWNSGLDPVYRLPFLSKIRPTHAMAGGPGNDMFTGGALLSVVQARLVTLWTQLYSMGIQPWTWTLGPHTTSTDNWETTANQTVNGGIYPGGNSAYLAARNAMNVWIKTLPYPLAGYVDINTVIENNPVEGDGLWAVTGVANKFTQDGAHPSSYADNLLAAIVPTAAFNAYV